MEAKVHTVRIVSAAGGGEPKTNRYSLRNPRREVVVQILQSEASVFFPRQLKKKSRGKVIYDDACALEAGY